jgi:hypothetical protein
MFHKLASASTFRGVGRERWGRWQKAYLLDLDPGLKLTQPGGPKYVESSFWNTELLFPYNTDNG